MIGYLSALGLVTFRVLRLARNTTRFFAPPGCFTRMHKLRTRDQLQHIGFLEIKFREIL